MRFNRCSAVVLVALIAAAGAGCSSSGGSSGGDHGGDVIKLGDLNDTSGTAAAFSGLTTDGMRLAIDEINKAGGIDGKQVELISESDGSVPTNTPAAVNKLISEGASVVLMNSNSASFLAVKQIFQQQKIVALSPQNSNAAIAAPPNNDYTFLMAPGTDQLGASLVAGMIKSGIKKLGVLSLQSPTVQGLDAVTLPPIKKAGIDVVQETIPLDATDVTAEVTKVLDAHVDAIYVDMLGGQQEVLVHNTVFAQAPDLMRFANQSVTATSSTLKLFKPGALKSLIALTYQSSANPRFTALQKKFQSKNGSDYVLSPFTADGYDSIYLIKKAIENGGSTDGPDVKAGLEKISGYQPTTGNPGFTVSFSASKHSGADGACGFALMTFNSSNQFDKPWSVYQPPCSG